jgi:ADP-ribosylglycohydrolase
MHSLAKKLIKTELKQRREEGCDVDAIADRIAAALADGASEQMFSALYDELMALPVSDAFPYVEPSELAEIQAQRPGADSPATFQWHDDIALDRIYGGWLGRAAGCCLGKPVEGWRRDRIEKYLSERNALPLSDYIPFAENMIAARLKPSTRGNIHCMDRDDDMDFPVLGLLALERKGNGTSARTIANTWVSRIPFAQTYTAEGVAYRNFTLGIWPPQSAIYRNPFREWIGAQIRADIFGYVMPGRPAKAAALAFADASVSHDKNGIYGEMLVAAMVAAAFVSGSIDDIVNAGLAQIPARCRLAEAVRNTQQWCRDELAGEAPAWQQVWSQIEQHYGHYHGVHTINNAAVVVMSLYFGAEDYEAGIVSSVLAGWDTDCNAATVGSILGVKFGAKALPQKWTGVLNDRLLSDVRGEADNKISDLAARTVVVAQAMSRDAAHVEPIGLAGEASGIWELETGWGAQLLKLSEGTVYMVDNDLGPFALSACSLEAGELKFSFAIDKGDWDFTADFEGRLDGDTIEGSYYPGVVPVTGRRMSHAE